MRHDHIQEKNILIDRIAELVRARFTGPQVEQAERYVRLYYDGGNIEDMRERPLEDLYGAAIGQMKFAQQRRQGEILLRVYNPRHDEHGWQSTHTVVEIIVDDMPFLVDSVSMELLREGYTLHAMMHPVLFVLRDDRGEMRQVLSRNDKEGTPEAVMRFEITRQTDAAALRTLNDELLGVLDDVRVVVEDWKPMRERVTDIIAALEHPALPVPDAAKQEAIQFLRWVAEDHFTFIGFRAYDLGKENGNDALRQVPGSGLGVLRDTSGDPARASQSFFQIPASLRTSVREPTLLIITKSTSMSTVHRPAHLDYIGIKRFDEAGDVIGEWRFLGLYSSLAYSARPIEIPILRKKIEYVVDRAGYPPASHDRKALVHILDTFPRDEMFQFGEQELLEVATGILQVQERHRLGLFLRRDAYGRFVTALVYVPRERYHTDLRRRIQDILMEALDGQNVEFNIQISESPLARVHFIIRTRPQHIPDYDTARLQARMIEAMLSWQDELQTALHNYVGEEQGAKLHHRYHDAFPPAYRDDYSPRTVVADIQRLESLNESQPLTTHLYRPTEDGDNLLRFKIFGSGQLMALSDVLPMLEHMGVRVLSARPYEITPRVGGPYWILDFDMMAAGGETVDVLEVKELFQETFIHICQGIIENDGFNRLVLAAELHWREVVMMRALCKYLLQTSVPFSRSYIEQSLFSNTPSVKLLVELFKTRFDPDLQKNAAIRSGELADAIEKALATVTNLDEDRILRQFLALIQAMLRTNFYQLDAGGAPKTYLSFKFDSAMIPTLPLPRPMFEIFVYSPRMEGVHLRGGPVARGGIRWSDRREDFRTEILGLMKAQMVKNAVIVPVGAKGGFVIKRPPATDDRDAMQEEVVHCYHSLIRGMLDLTDNLVDEKIVSPPQVVRYDSDDSYLVVAADKGTASFSDIANGIAEEYGFWLGDAFASGGSTGYDHKKMAITARGAWESVKRHFRELGKDIQSSDFTVVGIGDMAGDVFGNGMLLSPHIRLVAAFNHLHIFLDPEPDAARSFEERRRLFTLPRSSWSDYNPVLISAGGGVYSRRAKSIELSPEVRYLLGVETEQLTPNEVIQAILRAPVDLLWNGGIGTFAKASSESHTDVGDRSNDALRVDAVDLRCRVVGEGGNLGFTQRARIEYARHGGRINTDAIDNSGGVDCSDHEVNIKILLDQLVANGELTLKQRNSLLVDMTDEVASLVLSDNYLQPQAISIATRQGALLLSEHARLVRLLEKEGRIKRKLEALPSDEEIAEREAAHEGLTRPEIAVLLAHSKIRLSEALLSTDIAEDAFLSHELVSYFPTLIQQSYAQRLNGHPLRREIIATQITNGMINRMGSTFWLRMQEASGHHPADIARAYTAAREIFGARALWRAIEALDNQVSPATQLDMFSETRRLLDRATLWLLRQHRPPLDIAGALARYAEPVAALTERLPRLTKGEERRALQKEVRRWQTLAVPKEMALRVSMLDSLYAALDFTEVADKTHTDIGRTAEIYFILSTALELQGLKASIYALPRRDPWERRARTGLLDELQNALRDITKAVIAATPHIKVAEQRAAFWLEQKKVGVEHCRSLFADIRATGKQELAMFTVAVREIRAFAQSAGSR